MADFNTAIVKTLAREGGAKYTDDRDDPGGATKYGISQRAYPNLNIRNITEADARDIYKRDYWDRIRGDEIKSQIVAENIFDTAVNMGVRTAGKLAQLTFNINPVDGIIGRLSLKKINESPDKLKEELFIAKFTIAKIARYAYICNKRKESRKYLLGWINRSLGAV